MGIHLYAVFLASNDTDKKVIGIAYIPHASEILIHIKGGRQFLHFPMVEFYFLHERTPFLLILFGFKFPYSFVLAARSFEKCSHGFRPHRSCHTAIASIMEGFDGTRWFIEGDIKGFFDNIDHDIIKGRNTERALLAVLLGYVNSLGRVRLITFIPQLGNDGLYAFDAHATDGLTVCAFRHVARFMGHHLSFGAYLGRAFPPSYS